jgi:hypothetical protein
MNQSSQKPCSHWGHNFVEIIHLWSFKKIPQFGVVPCPIPLAMMNGQHMGGTNFLRIMKSFGILEFIFGGMMYIRPYK